jgi:ABC-type polysaccharide/polyol phosphate transport system ATPase subunit
MLRRASSGAREEFWALKGISLEIEQGERLGIIGLNGAGKSTLLKILSRITEPTQGRVSLKGETSSLLEVGTGFHPELTGRENIYLNAAILGMGRREASRRFDEIVEFAEVAKFIDTPVKFYSSGMYVRLAFSVAAHLRSDILIVDEVLAVGDAAFQKKCLERMEAISREAGRTVLYVSHNMPSILALSNRCVLLESGSIAADGAPDEVVQRYMGNAPLSDQERVDLAGARRYGTGRGRFVSVAARFRTGDGQPLSYAEVGCDLHFEAEIAARQDLRNLTVALIIYDALGNRLIDANTLIKGQHLDLDAGAKALVAFRLKRVLLKAGTYTAGLWLGRLNEEDTDAVLQALSFRIEPRREDCQYTAPFPGVYVCDFDIGVA